MYLQLSQNYQKQKYKSQDTLEIAEGSRAKVVFYSSLYLMKKCQLKLSVLKQPMKNKLEGQQREGQHQNTINYLQIRISCNHCSVGRFKFDKVCFKFYAINESYILLLSKAILTPNT